MTDKVERALSRAEESMKKYENMIKHSRLQDQEKDRERQREWDRALDSVNVRTQAAKK